ncbi:hypothetical protein SHIRM173S_03277 [Streptomyces hirsutus]
MRVSTTRLVNAVMSVRVGSLSSSTRRSPTAFAAMPVAIVPRRERIGAARTGADAEQGERADVVQEGQVEDEGAREQRGGQPPAAPPLARSPFPLVPVSHGDSVFLKWSFRRFRCGCDPVSDMPPAAATRKIRRPATDRGPAARGVPVV